LKKQTFKEKFPHLMKYWDYEKNNELGIYPEKVTCGTRKKAWFINEEGFRVERAIKQIKNEIRFFNNKLIVNEYSKEKLDFFKQKNNPNINLNTLTTCSQQKVIWTCPNNHNFIKNVHRFSDPTGTSCPECRKLGLKQKYNTNNNYLGNVRDSKLFKEYSKNNTKPASEVALGTGKYKVLWTCPICSNDYKASPWQRSNRKTGCPKCTSMKSQSRNEIRIYSELSSLFNNVCHNYKINGYKYDIYIKDINLIIEYDGSKWHSTKKQIERDLKKNKIAVNNNFNILRVREFGLEKINKDDIILKSKINNIKYEKIQILILKLILNYISENFKFNFYSYIDNFLNKNKFINIKDYNKKINEGYIENNLTKNRMFKQYNEEKTGLNPTSIANNSDIKVWWKCNKGKDHSWKERPANRNNPSSGCPFCSNKRISITNRLDKIHPNSINLWSDKNVNKPKNYTYRNGKDKIIWNCSSCNNEFTKTIAKMDDSKGYCPHCKKKHFL